MVAKKSGKKKLEVVFDPIKRKEFLTGFRKRKNERRKRAKEELERNVKNERKRIKQEIKEGFHNMKKSFEPLRELTEEDRAEENEYEDDDVKVKIVELSKGTLTSQEHMLGLNEEAISSESEQEENVEENAQDTTNDITGMSIPTKERTKNTKTPDTSNNKVQTNKNTDFPELKSKKDLNRLIKVKTLKQLKKSKIMKQKERVDKKVNRKKARREKNQTFKSLPKHVRKKKLNSDNTSFHKKHKQIRKKK